jgi:hypothetical protein
VAIEGITVDGKAPASLPLKRNLRTIVGGVLDAISIAKLLTCRLNVSVFDLPLREPRRRALRLIFGTFTSISAVAAVSVKAQIIPILAEVGCLIDYLFCTVLGLISSLIFAIIACLLPQITGCIDVFKILDITIIVDFLGLRL